MAKYDPTGRFEWVKQISGASPDGPLRLGASETAGVFLQGIFISGLTIDGIIVNSNGGAEHVFVTRFDGAGNVLWTGYDSGRYLSVGFGMGTGSSGGTAVTGFIKTGATFGDTELTVQGFDFFLVRYDPAGNATWAKQTGVSTSATGRVNGSASVIPYVSTSRTPKRCSSCTASR